MNQVPEQLTGVWRRLSIETENGQRDTTTQVIYLQTSSHFADIRIPGDRPDLSTKTTLAELPESEKIALSKQQGFAGITAVSDSICQWHRYIDYQPPTPLRDIGLLEWQNDILIETGIDVVYREEWQRIDDGQGKFTAIVIPADAEATAASAGWRACLITVGDHFIYAHSRAVPLPPAHALTDLIAGQDSMLQTAYLNCELSYGLCRSGQVPWQIQLSTLPWREKRSLWDTADATIAQIQQQLPTL